MMGVPPDLSALILAQLPYHEVLREQRYNFNIFAPRGPWKLAEAQSGVS